MGFCPDRSLPPSLSDMADLCRSFHIADLSAQDLQDVRLILNMKVYAIVSVSGDPFIDPNRWYTTSVDYRGRTSPRWNGAFFHFTLHDPSLLTNRLHLMFRFFCERTFHHHRFIGGTIVPLKCLFDLTGALDSFYPVCFPVKLPSGGRKGFLKLSFQFGKPLPRLINPAPPWPSHRLSSSHRPGHVEPPPPYPPEDPYTNIHSSQQTRSYDHQPNDLNRDQVQYTSYNFRSCSLPSAPAYHLLNSHVSSSFPSSSGHYPDSDVDAAYYFPGSYDDNDESHL